MTKQPSDLLVATERAAVLKRQMADSVQKLVGDGDPLAAPLNAYRSEFEERRADETKLQAIREANIRDLAGMYLDLFEGGTDRLWSRFKRQGLETIAIILAQMTANAIGGQGSIFAGIGSLLGSFGGSRGGGIGGFLGNLLPSLLPGRAAGGPVAAGTSYLVGEKGPEILRMGGQGGSIIPNHALNGAAASGAPSVVKVEVVGSRYFDAHVQTVAGNVTTDLIKVAAPEVIREATEIARMQAPAAVARANRLGTVTR